MIAILRIVFVCLLFFCQALASDTGPNEEAVNNDQECSIKDHVLEEDINWPLNDLDQDDPELVRIVKEKYLYKPSMKPINLTKPATAKTLQGQFNQPILLDAEYFGGSKKKGFFIEAGAIDGEFLSNTLYFEMKHQWTGLLIEPNSRYFLDLLKKNRNAWSFGHCLSTKKHPEVVLFHNAGTGSGIINSETNTKPGSKKYIGAQSVSRKQCFPLYTLLLALGNPKVHYFSLDVEGTELPILQNIPWDKVDIEAVGIEINHLGQIFPGNLTDLDNLMFANGYTFLGMAKIDKFYTKKKPKKTKPKKKKQIIS